MEEEGYSESSEEESIEEEDDDDEFDIKWMRLKVPLAAQNPEAMRRLVEQGRQLQDWRCMNILYVCTYLFR